MPRTRRQGGFTVSTSNTDPTVQLAEAMIQHALTLHPAARRRVNEHAARNTARNAHASNAINTHAARHGLCEQFKQMLMEQIGRERMLTKCGYVYPIEHSYGSVFTHDSNGHTVCVEGTLVHHGDELTSVFTFKPPYEVSSVLARLECSPRDVVRLATYLVCLCCQAVSLGHCEACFLGDAVSFLSQSLAAFRVSAGEDGDDEASQRDRHADHCDNGAHTVTLPEGGEAL